jgi:transposase-like protein
MMTDMDDGADPEAEVVSLSPRTLLDSSRYACEICGQMFRREQNLVFHRRGHDMPWKRDPAAAAAPRKRRDAAAPRKKRRDEAAASRKKRAFVCPEPSCLHHHPSHALADHCGIKKHFLRKHGGHRQWACARCSKAYAVLNDYKAHVKTCGGHSACGPIFTRYALS